MEALKEKAVWRTVGEVFLTIILVVVFIVAIFSAYFLGIIQGYTLGQSDAELQFLSFLRNIPAVQKHFPPPTGGLTPTPSVVETTTPTTVSWGGPELWESVNKRRVELGVNPLSSRSELCTFASIRLNEILELGKLDNHEGFSNMKERRPDLAWIFEKYSNISEFLAQGGRTPQGTVALWENTLGHSKLLTGGEYVWGCIYAQDTFAVAITAY